MAVNKDLTTRKVPVMGFLRSAYTKCINLVAVARMYEKMGTPAQLHWLATQANSAQSQPANVPIAIMSPAKPSLNVNVFASNLAKSLGITAVDKQVVIAAQPILTQTRQITANDVSLNSLWLTSDNNALLVNCVATLFNTRVVANPIAVSSCGIDANAQNSTLAQQASFVF